MNVCYNHMNILSQKVYHLPAMLAPLMRKEYKRVELKMILELFTTSTRSFNEFLFNELVEGRPYFLFISLTICLILKLCFGSSVG